MLGEFLQARLGASGPWNCSTMPADWCIALGHPDFAAKWRGVTDEAECDETAAAGLVKLWDEGIGEALPIAEAPFRPGDIGVVRRAGLEAGAIYTGARWALQGPHGVAFFDFPASAVLKGWRP